LKYLSLAPIGSLFSGAAISANAHPVKMGGQNNLISNDAPKRIAAIITEYRPNSHADVIIGKYLEGYNQDRQPPYPRSNVVSTFTQQVPETDMSRELPKKYNLPIFRTLADPLTLGGDKLEVDGVLLLGEHGHYPINDKEQKLHPRFE